MEQLARCCYGVEVRLADAAGLGLCQYLAEALPPEFVPVRGPASTAVSYTVTAATLPGTPERAGYHVTRDGVQVFAVSAEQEQDLFRWLRHDIDNAVAHRSRQMLFVRAGVVGWRGLAIVIPGASRSGQSTLVEALVRRGAMYYSDQFAVLDGAGMVHSYARTLSVPDEDGLPRDLRLEWADVPREALPVGLIVAGQYEPEATWRPAVLRGIQAVSPLIDHAVLAQEEPERTRQVAARVAATVVTLEGPQSNAADVAARLLDLIDTAFASLALDGDEKEPGRQTADLARVAETRFSSQVVWPLPPARRLVAARYVVMRDFLSPEDHQRMLDHAMACQDAFETSGILDIEDKSVVDLRVRRSRTLPHSGLDPVWNLFDGRLRAILPVVRQELGMSWFPLGEVERQITAHGGTGFYAPHVDADTFVAGGRRISCVYYFHASPRRFTGGELRLYDTWVTDDGSMGAQSYTKLVPVDNSLVFFPSDTLHEVCPVHPESEAFRDSRFAVTIWLNEGAWPATVTAASDAMRPAGKPSHEGRAEDRDLEGPRAGAVAKMSPRAQDHLLGRAALMHNRGIDLVLDVGANTGQFGVSLLDEIGYRGRIVSFEPLSDAFAELRRTTSRHPAWSCHNFALGEANQNATINISANSYSSSLLPVNERTLEIDPSVAYVGREAVRLRRLDDVFMEVVRPGETPYLKIDAQGYELNVLEGGRDVLERFPLIQVETSFFPVYKDQPLIGEVIQFLASLGFRVISFEPGWSDPRTGEMLQADLLFARP